MSHSNNTIIYSLTKGIITIPKKKTDINVEKNKLITDENNVYKFKKISPLTIIKHLSGYFISLFFIMLLIIFSVIKLKAQINVIDGVLMMFMFISGVMFYLGYCLPDKTGNKLYLFFLLIFFVCLFVSVFVKSFMFLIFLCFFCGMLSGGLLFWLVHGDTYIVTDKTNKVIFKIIQ